MSAANMLALVIILCFESSMQGNLTDLASFNRFTIVSIPKPELLRLNSVMVNCNCKSTSNQSLIGVHPEKITTWVQLLEAWLALTRVKYHDNL